MTSRSRKTRGARSSKRAPVRIAILGEWLTANKSTGQAYFLLHDAERGAKRRFYQGPMWTPAGEVSTETLDRAQRWLAERIASSAAPLHPERDRELSVQEVTSAFLRERETFADPKELGHFRSAFRPLRELYGTTPAGEFGPLALRAVRQRMIESGRLNRKTLNNHVERIRMAFKWAAGLEMVSVLVPQSLACVEQLRRGRVEGLRESKRVRAVPDEHVDSVLPYLSRQVAGIVQIMRWTGARCGEVVQMRPCDVNRSREPWTYTPPTHKTAHHGHDRRIWLGPQARAVLAPWLLRSPGAPCFSPIEAEAERQRQRTEARRTPEGVGNTVGCSQRTREGREARRAPQQAYTTDSVRRAISRACTKAGVPRWSPHQLRHAAATRYQHGAGWEEARLLLGHRSVDVTAQYAERDEATAAATAERLG